LRHRHTNIGDGKRRARGECGGSCVVQSAAALTFSRFVVVPPLSPFTPFSPKKKPKGWVCRGGGVQKRGYPSSNTGYRRATARRKQRKPLKPHVTICLVGTTRLSERSCELALLFVVEAKSAPFLGWSIWGRLRKKRARARRGFITSGFLYR